jgi:diguanylate cyclase
MNMLDPTTLYVLGGVIICITGVYFILETLLKRNDQVGRMWSVFYIGAIFSVFAMLVGSAGPETWWASAVGHGFYVTAVGFVWVGARIANRRRSSLIGVPIVVGLAVIGSRLLAGPESTISSLYIGASIFFAFGAVEAVRGDLARLRDGRLLSVLLGLGGLYYASRTVTMLIVGADDPTFQILFGESSASLFEIAVAVLGTLTLSALQGDRFRRAAIAQAEFGARVAIDGILVRETFRELAESWLMRSIRERMTLVLLLVEVADLAEVNVAFGRAAGDAALRTTGRLTLVHAPTAALIGHVSPRRYAILMELPTNDSVEAIADRIADAVLSTPIDDQDRFRASTFCGVATTRTSGARYDDLLRAATEAVRTDRETIRASAEDARTGGILTRS